MTVDRPLITCVVGFLGILAWVPGCQDNRGLQSPAVPPTAAVADRTSSSPTPEKEPSEKDTTEISRNEKTPQRLSSDAAVNEKTAMDLSEVQLSEPQVRIDERGIFWFGVKYRFLRGQPRKHYELTVTFPGTQNLCIKRMESWELKSEGEIKDGIPLYEQPIKSYEITFSEADSPMNSYSRISNTLVGTMDTPSGNSELKKSELKKKAKE